MESEMELLLFMMKELFFFSIYFTNAYFLILHKFGEIWLTDMYLTQIDKQNWKVVQSYRVRHKSLNDF